MASRLQPLSAADASVLAEHPANYYSGRVVSERAHRTGPSVRVEMLCWGAHRRMDERFWRQAASGTAKAAEKGAPASSAAALSRSAKRKRATLPKRKRLKRLKKAAVR